MDEYHYSLYQSYLNSGRYSHSQLKELEIGLEKSLQVGFYANPELSVEQMREIRYGLEDDVDVTSFASASWYQPEQMKEIRLGLKAGVETAYYNDVSYPAEFMRIIRLGLESRLEIRWYTDPTFTISQASLIYEGLKQDLDVSKYAFPSFEPEQMLVIKKGLESGINIDLYADNRFSFMQMTQIRQGLESGLTEDEVMIYAKLCYNEKQMWQIKSGMLSKLDYGIYLNPELNENQMQEIRLGLLSGIDVSLYCDPSFTYEEMRQIRTIFTRHRRPVRKGVLNLTQPVFLDSLTERKANVERLNQMAEREKTIDADDGKPGLSAAADIQKETREDSNQLNPAPIPEDNPSYEAERDISQNNGFINREEYLVSEEVLSPLKTENTASYDSFDYDEDDNSVMHENPNKTIEDTPAVSAAFFVDDDDQTEESEESDNPLDFTDAEDEDSMHSDVFTEESGEAEEKQKYETPEDNRGFHDTAPLKPAGASSRSYRIARNIEKKSLTATSMPETKEPVNNPPSAEPAMGNPAEPVLKESEINETIPVQNLPERTIPQEHHPIPQSDTKGNSGHIHTQNFGPGVKRGANNYPPHAEKPFSPELKEEGHHPNHTVISAKTQKIVPKINPQTNNPIPSHRVNAPIGPGVVQKKDTDKDRKPAGAPQIPPGQKKPNAFQAQKMRTNQLYQNMGHINKPDNE